MIQILPAQSGEPLEQMIALAREYIDWMTAEIALRYPDFDRGEFVSAHDYEELRGKFPGEHVPPDGCLLIALRDGDACGCIGLARLDETTAEMRTLFVRPAGRGAGVGRALVLAVLERAQASGYARVRLDTLDFMADALRLYRGLGFRDIEPYLDFAPSIAPHICFLERELPDQSAPAP